MGYATAKTEESDPLGILIVCEHASARFGGESILPLHYFRILRRRGVDVRIVAHERTRGELVGLLPEEAGRMYFLPDNAINRLAWRLGSFLPAQIDHFTFGYLIRLGTQRAARDLARRLIAEHGINVVHQPIPVSPRETSLLYDLGAPVVIGPMNGNMSYPPAFARRGKLKFLGAVVGLTRLAAGCVHRLMPGKLRAAVLLVANERTRAALPSGARGEVIPLVENGVDLQVWAPIGSRSEASRPARFVFLGRLVDWKAVDLLLEAFAQVRATPLPRLDILGDGPMRAALEDQARSLGISERIHFTGWLPQSECARRLRDSDVLVLPSLYECGGAVVLEAMACGLPVIATAWGGPKDYLDSTCGILVAPESREALIGGFARAMNSLANDRSRSANLGRAGRERVERMFDWETKVDHVLAVYRRVASLQPQSASGKNNHPPHAPQHSSVL